MRDLHFSYDQEADVLYIVFAKGHKASSVSLNDNLILRFDAQTGAAVGLTILDFARLWNEPRHLPLTRLNEFPPKLREVVWQVLTHPPISYYLQITTPAPTPSPTANLAREFSLANLLAVAGLVAGLAAVNEFTAGYKKHAEACSSHSLSVLLIADPEFIRRIKEQPPAG